jgi:transposase-like protein
MQGGLVVLDLQEKLTAGKAKLQEIWMAATTEDAIKALDLFVQTYQAKYPNAVECLLKDTDELFAFYDFPAEHWRHLRTSNAIESTFATVQLRTYKTKGPGSREAGLVMVFRLVEQAQKRWRKLNGSNLLPDVIGGIQFVDGVKSKAAWAEVAVHSF